MHSMTSFLSCRKREVHRYLPTYPFSLEIHMYVFPQVSRVLARWSSGLQVTQHSISAMMYNGPLAYKA